MGDPVNRAVAGHPIYRMPYAYATEFIQRASSATIDPLEVSPSALRLLRLDFGSSAAAQSNQSWVKKRLVWGHYIRKKNSFIIFIFILFLVVSVSPRNTKLRPLTELFFKNSTAKIPPDQSPRPNGPRLMREVLPSNLLMKRLLSAWKGKKMEGMSIFLEV